MILVNVARSADSLTASETELQGNWATTEVEVEGAKVSAKTEATFNDREWIFTIADKSQKYKISFSKPRKDKQKPIDLLLIDGPDEGKRVQCIYEIKAESEVSCGSAATFPAFEAMTVCDQRNSRRRRMMAWGRASAY